MQFRTGKRKQKRAFRIGGDTKINIFRPCSLTSISGRFGRDLGFKNGTQTQQNTSCSDSMARFRDTRQTTLFFNAAGGLLPPPPLRSLVYGPGGGGKGGREQPMPHTPFKTPEGSADYSTGKSSVVLGCSAGSTTQCWVFAALTLGKRPPQL